MDGVGASEPRVPVLDVLAWVETRDGRVLMVRSRGREVFYLPGGKREPGESDVVALRREVREELGVELDPESFTLVAEIVAPAHDGLPGQRVRMRSYRARGRGQARPLGEVDELAWLSTRDRARAAPAARRVFDVLASEIATSTGAAGPPSR